MCINLKKQKEQQQKKKTILWHSKFTSRNTVDPSTRQDSTAQVHLHMNILSRVNINSTILHNLQLIEFEDVELWIWRDEVYKALTISYTQILRQEDQHP